MEITSKQVSLFSTKVYSWENSTTNSANQLEMLINSINPFTVLSTIKSLVEIDISEWIVATVTILRKLEESQKKLYETKSQLQQQLENINAERTWWQSAWQAIPDRLKPIIPSTGLFELNFLRNVKAQFDSWQQELEQEETYLSRYQHLLQDWIARLHNPSNQYRNELKQIYLDNANVIGITCVQAAKRSFSEEFKNFDVVIIDEVSKCTPPELLIPALKGKKLVLIGDYRQLPPMLNENTVEDVAEQMGVTPEELSFLEESLFKIQFASANEHIKQMLTFQYRMHPQIMGAINQFYDHRLKCGLLEADTQRAHNLASSIIKSDQHLVWVTTPIGQGFEERSEGTSYVNEQEVEAIAKLCEQMDKTWFPMTTQGEPRKEVGIITFYGGQLKLIKDRINPKNFPSLIIRTGTVDRFQGMERQIVIVSMVRNNRDRKVGFAKKPERVNVAFSRAQELLVIVGCHDLFTQQSGKIGSMYSEVVNVVRRHGGLIDVSHIL